jgi:hypothetical protein
MRVAKFILPAQEVADGRTRVYRVAINNCDLDLLAVHLQPGDVLNVSVECREPGQLEVDLYADSAIEEGLNPA